MAFRPRQTPLSRLMGATPTRAAIFRRSRRPSSGSSAIRVRRVAFAYSRHAGEEIGVGLPGGAVLDRPVDLPIELGKLGLQELDMAVDRLEDARLGGETATIFLRHNHLDDLPPTRHEFAERLGLAIGEAPGGGTDGFGEMGDRRGVEAIGLGELAGRTGKIADLTRIDHRQGQMLGGKGAGDHGLVSPVASSVTRAGARARKRSTRRSRPSSSRVTTKVSPLGRTQMSSRSFDTSIPMNSSISRPCTCGLATRPRTVRDLGIGGWGAMLRNGLFDPRSARAPIRRRGANLSSAARPRGDTRSAEGASRRML